MTTEFASADSSAAVMRTSKGLELCFKPLEARDLEAVLKIEHQVQSHPWRRSSFEDCLNGGRQRCWLATKGEQLLGFVVLTWGGGEAELLNIAVAPEQQGLGIGRCLLHWALELASSQADVMFLEVRVSNHRAIEFYSYEDFFEVGQRPNYYPAASGREDALILMRQLN